MRVVAPGRTNEDMPGRAYLHKPPSRGWASAAACLSGSTAEPPHLPLCLADSFSRAYPRQSSGWTSRKLCLSESVATCTLACSAHIWLPSLHPSSARPFLAGDLALLRIATSAYPRRPPPQADASEARRPLGLKCPSGSGLALPEQTQEGSEHPPLRFSLLTGLGSNWRGAFMRSTLQS